MSGDSNPSDTRADLLDAARERLRAHLADEADALAEDGPPSAAVAEVQAFLDRLGTGPRRS